MADQKLTELTALTSPTADDILYIVDDPSGSPLSRKITHSNLFLNRLSNIALHKSYTLTAPEAGYPDSAGMLNTSGTTWNTMQKLTDGLIGSLSYSDGFWVGWLHKDFFIRLDLGAAYSGKLFSMLGLHADASGIKRPLGIKLEYSDNDSDWSSVEDRSGMSAGTGNQYWISEIDISGSGSHRYWKLSITHDGSANNYTMMSEIYFYI